MKFIRAFCYGLAPDEETIAEIHGQTVLFSYETPQVDIAIDADSDAKTEPAPAQSGTVSDSNTTTV